MRQLYTRKTCSFVFWHCSYSVSKQTVILVLSGKAGSDLKVGRVVAVGDVAAT